MAIPPTGPAIDQNNGTPALRIGLAQVLAEVSNLANVPIVNPNDTSFPPDDPKAAVASLGAGERAYVTLRAIGVGSTPPDPADLLRWGVKALGSDTSGTGSPFAISTVFIPDDAARKTNVLDTIAVATTGGSRQVSDGPTSKAVCTNRDGDQIFSAHLNGQAPATTGAITGSFVVDLDTGLVFGPFDGTSWGNPQDSVVDRILRGNTTPAPNLGYAGNYYIDLQLGLLYGPKTASDWGSGPQPRHCQSASQPACHLPVPIGNCGSARQWCASWGGKSLVHTDLLGRFLHPDRPVRYQHGRAGGQAGPASEGAPG